MKQTQKLACLWPQRQPCSRGQSLIFQILLGRVQYSFLISPRSVPPVPTLLTSTQPPSHPLNHTTTAPLVHSEPGWAAMARSIPKSFYLCSSPPTETHTDFPNEYPTSCAFEGVTSRPSLVSRREGDSVRTRKGKAAALTCQCR